MFIRVSMIRLLFVLSCLCAALPARCQGGLLFQVSQGEIRFHSEAPQELIRAASGQVKGVLDVGKKTFAFRVPIGSFQGFNSPLQREHFNENYMESTQYPEATFSGKIIEDVDLSKNGEYLVRAKGKLQVHGLEQERIIPSKVVVKGDKILISSDFTVLLADHNIKIPRVVAEKLSPEIKVSLTASMLPRK